MELHSSRFTRDFFHFLSILKMSIIMPKLSRPQKFAQRSVPLAHLCELIRPVELEAFKFIIFAKENFRSPVGFSNTKVGRKEASLEGRVSYSSSRISSPLLTHSSAEMDALAIMCHSKILSFSQFVNSTSISVVRRGRKEKDKKKKGSNVEPVSDRRLWMEICAQKIAEIGLVLFSLVF